MEMRQISSAIGIAALALLILSCEKPDAELVGPLWRLESVKPEGAKAIKPDPSRTYTIQFFADSTLVGVADCDDLFGEYLTRDGSRIRYGNGGVTRRGCAEADPPIDKYYPAAFVNTININYEINGNKLLLHVKNLKTSGNEADLNFDTSD